MLDAALDLLAADGVTVALDGLQLEDVIRHADVSRTSAYRRWPTREAFLEDVLVELAHGIELADVGPRIAAAAAPLLEHRESLHTEQGRRELFVDLLRVSFQTDLEAIYASPQFQTYLALRAAFVGVPSDELRGRLAAALVHSERRAVARGSVILLGACRLLGLRLTGPLGAGPDGAVTLARAIAATTTGFVVTALADPDVLRESRREAPFGSTRTAAWSLPALTLTGLVLAHVEPDPRGPDLDAGTLEEALQGLVAAGAAAAAGA
ncbi:TetR family transcriptional regulator [Cellulomonas sp.]|uniref:TetR family transcriptional regulator n=1 Tax=Cellulomonas sp. TaxID=40001 RepID=UPI001B0785FB|nr:TetR family transcriptional regulator [Cellulomonas sp.]MBO9553580.1 TetR family transcriptional regulator [Cellulomonas sp.]